MSADEKRELIELRDENARLRKEVRDLTWTVLAQTKANGTTLPGHPQKPERFDAAKAGRGR